MTMKRISTLLCCASALLCAQAGAAATPGFSPPAVCQADIDQEPPPPPKLDETLYEHFGAGVREGVEWVSVADLLARPEPHIGKAVRVRGPISSICQKKGCWMHLGSEERPVMVKFKDYAFFMPKDGAGRIAVLDGVLSLKQETVEETRHYLEDAGKHEEAKRITEGRKIYTLLASGVALRSRAEPLSDERFEQFGERLLDGPWTDVATVMASPEAYLGRTLRLRGPITSVCQKKGCWMHLGSEAAPVMVKFKDYAFFVPKQAAGRIAHLEGVLTLRQETVEQTRHYLEDAGKHEEAKRVTEGRKLLFFVAYGAALTRVE